MTTAPVLAFLCFFLISKTTGFLPNQYVGALAGSFDYTHQDITEIGILNVVARFFEAHPRPGKPIPTGSLTGIPDITARKLFDGYYGSGVSEKRFQEAIDDVVQANNKVDQDHPTEAVWHCNGEAIVQAHHKMQTLRDTIIHILSEANPNYDAAREVIGEYLHIMQMFYSNSNWVELFGNKPYTNLGIHGMPIMATASYSFDTCKDCGAAVGVPCMGNIILSGHILTSSYRSGQDIGKPYKDPTKWHTGKCSHGGPHDASSNTPAKGGINKDTTNPTMSPHFTLHIPAAEAAINATEYFLDGPSAGIRDVIGDTKFQELFQLKSGDSLVFVMDTTGSMKAEVNALKQKAQEIVTETKGSLNEPYNYILITFNDPGNKTDVKITKNATEMFNMIGNIHVEGGGDCPEFSLTGVKAAAVVANPNSKIYVFTDATPKDPTTINYITSLLAEKKLHVEFLLTGTCKGRKRSFKSNIFPYLRNKRAAAVDYYHMIANKSGGVVYSTDKTSITKLTDIIKEETTRGATVTIIKATNKGSNISIPVDTEVSSISIKLHGLRFKPQYRLYRPDGKVETFRSAGAERKEFSADLLILKIKHPSTGEWTLVHTGSDTYEVDVSASSTADFSTQFMEMNALGYPYPLSGRPISGHDIMTIVKLPTAYKFRSVDYLLLMSRNGHEVERVKLKPFPTRHHDSFSANVKLPLQDTQMAIIGYDKAGNKFRRQQTDIISPVSIKLDILNIKGSLFKNEDLEIPYKVTNMAGATTSIDVEITDDKRFVKGAGKKSFTLKGNEQKEDKFMLHGGPSKDVTDTVTITASLKGSTSSNLQYQIRRFTTEEHIIRKVDNSTPEAVSQVVNGDCRPDERRNPCHGICGQYNWTVDTEISEEGFGLYQIYASDGVDVKLGSFWQGWTIDNGTVHVQLRGNCCYPFSNLYAVDLGGNTGNWEFNLAKGHVSQANRKTTCDVAKENSTTTPVSDTTADSGGMQTTTLIGIAAGSAVGLGAISTVIGVVVKRSLNKKNQSTVSPT